MAEITNYWLVKEMLKETLWNKEDIFFLTWIGENSKGTFKIKIYLLLDNVVLFIA